MSAILPQVAPVRTTTLPRCLQHVTATQASRLAYFQLVFCCNFTPFSPSTVTSTPTLVSLCLEETARNFPCSGPLHTSDNWSLTYPYRLHPIPPPSWPPYLLLLAQSRLPPPQVNTAQPLGELSWPSLRWPILRDPSPRGSVASTSLVALGLGSS